MERNHDFESPIDQPQYPGEDTRLTSKKELLGWYSYGWAAEVRRIFAMALLHVSNGLLQGLCHLRSGILHTDHSRAAGSRARRLLVR